VAKEVPVLCPVSGEPASKSVHVPFNGGKVHFRCAACKAKFEKHPEKYAAKANHQLVSTGQATQAACPVSAGKCSKDVKLNVAGVDVGFFCAGCRSQVAEAKADKQLELVFGSEAFKRAYKIHKQPAKAEKQPAKTEPAKTEQPEKKG
jgi:hypothetical protein